LKSLHKDHQLQRKESRIQHFEAHSKKVQTPKRKTNDLKMFDAGTTKKTNAKIDRSKIPQVLSFLKCNSNVIKRFWDAMANILLRNRKRGFKL
jgi:hypothetical protein